MSSPVERTLKLIREQGGFPWIVERYIHQRKLKIDLLHIIDLIALSSEGIQGWQVCGSDFGTHKVEMLEEQRENTIKWLETPSISLFLIGWRKLKVRRGGKAMCWRPRIGQISLENDELRFEEVE